MVIYDENFDILNLFDDHFFAGAKPTSHVLGENSEEGYSENELQNIATKMFLSLKTGYRQVGRYEN